MTATYREGHIHFLPTMYLNRIFTMVEIKNKLKYNSSHYLLFLEIAVLVIVSVAFYYKTVDIF